MPEQAREGSTTTATFTGSTTARYKVIPDEEMPAGRVVDIDATPECITLRIRRGHMSEALCRVLNDYHKRVLGGWAQRWGSCDDRGPGGERGVQLLECRYELLPASRMPADEICTPMLDKGIGSFIIFVRDDGQKHLSPEAVAEINVYIQNIVDGGLWMQVREWGDPSGPSR
jgi:hypothetical protein